MLRAIVFYAMVAGGVPLSIFEPFYGLLLYLFFAHAHPADFVWSGYIFNYGMVLVPALIVGYVIFEARKSPPLLRGMILLLAFWLWLTAATVLAYDTPTAFAMLTRFSKMFVVSFIIAALANTEARIGTMLRVIAISLGLLGLKGLLDIILTGGRYRMQGPGGMLSEENEYSLGMNMAIPMLYWLATVEERRWLRRLYQLAALGCAATVVFTYSRSGFLGLILVCFLIAVHSRRKWLAPAGLAAFALLFILFAPQGAIDRYKTIPTASQTDPSAIGRLQAWETAVQMAKAHPFFGVGLRNFELTFSNYTAYEPRAPHNAFVALTAESGIPSCLLFIAVIFAAIVGNWLRYRRLRRDPGHRLLATYCLIVHSTLIVYIVPNLFINRQDFDLMYHLVGLSAGMHMVIQRKLMAQLEPIEAPLEAATGPYADVLGQPGQPCAVEGK